MHKSKWKKIKMEYLPNLEVVVITNHFYKSWWIFVCWWIIEKTHPTCDKIHLPLPTNQSKINIFEANHCVPSWGPTGQWPMWRWCEIAWPRFGRTRGGSPRAQLPCGDDGGTVPKARNQHLMMVGGHMEAWKELEENIPLRTSTLSSHLTL